MATSSHRDAAPLRIVPTDSAAGTGGGAAGSFGRWTPKALAGGRRRAESVSTSGAVTPWRGVPLDGRGAGSAPLTGSNGVDASDETAQERVRSFEDGRQAGRAEAMTVMEPAARALHDASLALAGAREEILHDLRSNVAALALAVAKRIIGREVETDPAVVRELVAQGLELVKPDSPVEIRLHPSDLEVVQAGIETRPGDETIIQWTADPDLQRGGYFIEGPRRIVDGRLDEAMRVLYERLAYE